MNTILLPLRAPLHVHFQTPYHLGSGRAEGLVNRTVRRTADGHAYVPASALKGALRQSTERLVALLNQSLRQLGADEEDCLGRRHRAGTIQPVPCRAPAPSEMCQSTTPCIICRIFGNVFTGSRLVVDDTYPDKDQKEVKVLKALAESGEIQVPRFRSAGHETITRVRMDRRRRSAEAGALFSSEYSRAELILRSRLSGHVQQAANPAEGQTPPELILLAAAIRFTDHIGAEVSSGRGHCRLTCGLDDRLEAGGAPYRLDDLIDRLDSEDLLLLNV